MDMVYWEKETLPFIHNIWHPYIGKTLKEEATKKNTAKSHLNWLKSMRVRR